MINNRVLFFVLCYIVISLTISLEEAYGEEQHGNDSYVSTCHAGIFIGATTNIKHESTDFTIGLDYEYRMPYVNNLFGIGLLIEGVFAEHMESIVGIPVIIHPGISNLKLWLAPGIEFGDEEIESGLDEHKIVKKPGDILLSANDTDSETEFKTHFLFRMGVGYDYHIDIFSISPSVSIDFINGGTALVYGVAFGMSF
ncbi:hypothetical protein ACFLSQ_03790 [Bacteroidota bacterium]